MTRRDNNGGFLLGALFGAAVAGVAALLYAPKSGEELRKDVSKEVDNFMDRARDYTDLAVERGVEYYDAAAETLSEVSDDIQLEVMLQSENIKTKFNELKEEGKKFASEKGSELEDLAEDLKADAKDAKKDAERFVEDVADEAKDAKDDAEKAVREVKKDAERAAEDVKDDVEKAAKDVKKA